MLAANRCAPVPVVQNAVPDSYLAVQGTTVHYACIEGFTPLASSPQLTVCDGVNWTATELPGCRSKHVISDDVFPTLLMYIIFPLSSIYLDKTKHKCQGHVGTYRHHSNIHDRVAIAVQ